MPPGTPPEPLDAEQAPAQVRARGTRRVVLARCPEIPTDSSFPFGIRKQRRGPLVLRRNPEHPADRRVAETVKAFLDDMDEDRPPRGHGRLYSSAELETVFVLRLLYGENTTVRDARRALAGDEGGRARRMLGFDRRETTSRAAAATITGGSTVFRPRRPSAAAIGSA